VPNFLADDACRAAQQAMLNEALTLSDELASLREVRRSVLSPYLCTNGPGAPLRFRAALL
jgi:hypothetical protein